MSDRIEVDGEAFAGLDSDALRRADREVAAHVVGADGDLTRSTVDEDGEADLTGAPRSNDSVEGRADRAAGVQHIVDEEDRGAGQVGERARRVGGHVPGAVVTEGGHVQADRRNVVADERRDASGEGIGEGIATGSDANDDEARAAPVVLDDFGSQTVERASHTAAGDEKRRTGRRRRVAGRGVPDIAVSLPHWNIAFRLPHVRRSPVVV